MNSGTFSGAYGVWRFDAGNNRYFGVSWHGTQRQSFVGSGFRGGGDFWY